MRLSPDYFSIAHKAAVAHFQPPVLLDRRTDGSIKVIERVSDEFRAASKEAPSLARQQQLLERVRVCLDLLADVEEDLMMAAGER